MELSAKYISQIYSPSCTGQIISDICTEKTTKGIYWTCVKFDDFTENRYNYYEKGEMNMAQTYFKRLHYEYTKKFPKRVRLLWFARKLPH